MCPENLAEPSEEDDGGNEIYGLPEERIHIQIDYLKKSVHGKWEYAVWRGEEQLVLGWRETLEEIPAGIIKALTEARAL